MASKKKQARGQQRGKSPKTARGHHPARGKRYTPEQRQHALLLLASGVKKSEVAKSVGTTEESLRRWEKQGPVPTIPSASPCVGEVAASQEAVATSAVPSPYRPKDPGQGLSEAEQAAILECKKKHPSMGPAQIRAQLKRFKGWRLSTKAIARVLKAHGYEPVHVRGRPQGPEPIRFEAPRPNALWQADFAELRVGAQRRYVLLVLDDFSRFCVGHVLCESPSAEVSVELLSKASARYGRPESVRTDRGGGFLAAEFTKYLEAELIDHIVGRSYHPEGGGKVESLVGTLRRELWDTEHFDDWPMAERRLADWIAHYNTKRAHMGIDGLTPADRYFGRADEVLSHIDAVSRRRNGAHAQRADKGAAFEEVSRGGPMEVLRLVIVDGHMELRLCGARVVLGKVEV
jgi:putative transposase